MAEEDGREAAATYGSGKARSPSAAAAASCLKHVERRSKHPSTVGGGGGGMAVMITIECMIMTAKQMKEEEETDHREARKSMTRAKKAALMAQVIELSRSLQGQTHTQLTQDYGETELGTARQIQN